MGHKARSLQSEEQRKSEFCGQKLLMHYLHSHADFAENINFYNDLSV